MLNVRESATAALDRRSTHAPPRGAAAHTDPAAAGVPSAQALSSPEHVVPRGLSPGDVLDDRYVLRERIGAGGMGSVFVADQPSLGRSVAIKLLHPNFLGTPQLVHNLQREAALACRIRDPHCVAVFDCGALQDGTPYIVMEYIAGRTLGRTIADEAISIPRAVALFDQVLAALAAVHRGGIIHGDVKSNNFLVEQRCASDHLVLIDFGLARTVSEPPWLDRGDHESVVTGTPEYMAPELLETHEPSPVSDLYGAGVILYELLTGTVPFTGRSDIEVLRRHAHEDVVPPSRRRTDRKVPATLDRVVLRALDKRPDARFPDAQSFACAIHAAVNTSHRSWHPPRRPRAAPVSNARTSRPDGAATPRSGRAAFGGHLRALRGVISRALRRDTRAIADGYIALASALAHVRRFACAAHTLQEGIDILTAECDLNTCTRELADRIELALAALYERAGKRHLARSTAMVTDDRPTCTCAAGHHCSGAPLDRRGSEA